MRPLRPIINRLYAIPPYTIIIKYVLMVSWVLYEQFKKKDS